MRIRSSWDEDEVEGDGIYCESERSEMVENGEISAEEEAFMRGWEEAA